MNSVRRALVSTALAGAMALGGTAIASAAPAITAAPGASSVSAAETTAAAGWFTGYGSGAIEFLAVFQAENQAYQWAWIHGGFERWQCSVTSTQVTPFLNGFNAQVTVYCF
ncbi:MULTISPECIES: hypothetical protein [Actinoalloteichus]|uniref:Uncharacterized protein n=1 Tax=Actinoalloteichus fjordicus TaxID=1612552 RepID=A0AAC9PS45_9PSEU|nr:MULTISPECIES: hypothetical protein [Actinoalloteichus]APU14617.1 hypothetical protein UA74_12795 [Actinoalloteichus fjordicus]APU20585.1 hypothetical protein UA75_12875 [Actinoalloteichus sp. GBA129-24]